ncbi:MAG: TIGR00730 family Rossman fold protein [Pseudomonadota bacterium]
MKRVCVFCGSSPGKRPQYLEMAERLGNLLVKNNMGLVYGGGDVGTMGKIARVVFEQGGEVIGVIPKALAQKEVAYKELSDLRVVDSMHERKALMAELSDAFIALPGGLGTIEEFFEVLTWAQLGIHSKPCGILNVSGYYDHIIKFLNEAVDQNFVRSVDMARVLIDESPEELLKKFKTYKSPKVDKVAWILGLKNS